MSLNSRKIALFVVAILLALTATTSVHADSDDLLDQAIEENRGTEPQAVITSNPLAQAEQLIATGELSRAIQILEAARAIKSFTCTCFA